MSVSVLPQILTDNLEHDLARHFAALARFESTPEMKQSGIYQALKPEIERVLNSVVQENFGKPSDFKSETVRAAAWNIERGIELPGIADALSRQADLRGRDLYLITELDDGMARSGNFNVPRELARRLNLNYVFAPKYIALNKGSGVEAFAEGENTKALHGLGIFSPFPLERSVSIPIPSGRDKMLGKEKRLGGNRALVAEVKHPAGRFRAAVAHLDAHSSRAHRVVQMKTLLDFLETLPPMPTVVGGDWNTTTHNSQTARRAIFGYWRRVFMGARNAAQNHYPFPERFFEKGLFDLLDSHGYKWREFNALGVGTLHYDADSFEKNTNLGDWIPAWCFPWIRWAMAKVGNRISLKLDWFAGKNICLAKNSEPKVIGNLVSNEGKPLSDHDAIVLEFEFGDERTLRH
jgi:hypothetical protein